MSNTIFIMGCMGMAVAVNGPVNLLIGALILAIIADVFSLAGFRITYKGR